MNIKEFYKTTKQDLDKKSEEFNFTKKQIKKMIEQGKKNGEEINNICDNILVITKDTANYCNNWFNYEKYNDLIYRITMIEENVNNIKNIVGKNNG